MRRTSLLRALVAHVVAAALTTSVWLALAWILARTLERMHLWQPLSDRGTSLAAILAGAGALLYTLSVAIHYLLVAFDESRQAEQRALRAELASREAELLALKSQLNPHFLFNSLNSISSLITSDPVACREMCVELGDFLRGTLDLGGRRSHPLAEELAHARRYLRIEKARFGDRLEVCERIGQGCERIAVPTLILQPLIENALKHGISGLIEGGTIVISAARAGEELHLAVESPFDPDSRPRYGTGLGLENARRRLSAELGSSAELRVSRLSSRPPAQAWRFRVDLRLPASSEEPSRPSGPSRRAQHSTTRPEQPVRGRIPSDGDESHEGAPGAS